MNLNLKTPIISYEFKYPKELAVGDLVYKDWPMAFGISIVLEISQNKTHPVDTDILVLTFQNTIQILKIPNYKTIRCQTLAKNFVLQPD